MHGDKRGIQNNNNITACSVPRITAFRRNKAEKGNSPRKGSDIFYRMETGDIFIECTQDANLKEPKEPACNNPGEKWSRRQLQEILRFTSA